MISSLRGTRTGTGMRSVMTAAGLAAGDPAEPCYQVRLARPLSPGLEAACGPCRCWILAWWRAAIFDTVDWCLAGRVGCPARSRVHSG